MPDPEGESAKNSPQGKALYRINEDNENPSPKKATKKHLLDSPSPVKTEIILANQYTPITLNKIEKKQMPDSVQINSCPPATFLLQPCVGIIWRNNSCSLWL